MPDNHETRFGVYGHLLCQYPHAHVIIKQDPEDDKELQCLRARLYREQCRYASMQTFTPLVILLVPVFYFLLLMLRSWVCS